MLDIRAGIREAGRRTATSSPSAQRASPRPICPTSRRRSAVTRASWRRRRTTPARWRRCSRSRAATTTACPPSRRWSRSCARGQAWDQVVELLELRLAVEDAVERPAGDPGRDRAHPRAGAARHRQRVRDLGARADRGSDGGGAAAGAGAAGGGDGRLEAARRGLRRAHGRDVRCVAAAVARAAPGGAVREGAGRSGARRGVPAQGAGAAGRRGAGAGGAGDRSCGGRARTRSWPRSWRARPRSRAIRASRPTSWRRSARCA